MAVAGVLVLPEEFEQFEGFVPREEVVADLVVRGDRGNPHHFGHLAWDGDDVFAELHELFDGHHILAGGDDLDLRQPVFFVPLNELAVELVEVGDTLVVQPVAELSEAGPVVLERLVGDAGFLVVEESVLGVVWWGRFEGHCLTWYSPLNSRV